MAIGVASLALLLLPPRRLAYLLGFLVCAGLMAWALWLQYGDGARAVPAVHVPARRGIAVGIVFLIACDPQSRGASARRLRRPRC